MSFSSSSQPIDWFKKTQEDLEYIKRLQGQPKSTPVTFKDLPKETQEYLNNQTKIPYRDPNKPNPAVTEVFGSDKPGLPLPPNNTSGTDTTSGTNDYSMLIILVAVGAGLLLIN
jgi:hypothetical protein